MSNASTARSGSGGSAHRRTVTSSPSTGCLGGGGRAGGCARSSDETNSTEIKGWVLPPGERVRVFGRWRDGVLVPSPSRSRGLPADAGSVHEIKY